MTTLYNPVLIESAEQAEALPVGTFAVRWHVPWIGERRGPDENGHTWWESKNGIYDHVDVIGDTALVPIEAEEETEGSWDHCTPACPRGEHEHPDRTRLVTPWEEA